MSNVHNVNEKEETFSGQKNFGGITKKNQKNFDFHGSDDDNTADWLVLNTLGADDDPDIKGNPNFFYYGYSGWNGLAYQGYYDDETRPGSISPVKLEISTDEMDAESGRDDDFDFKLSGGHATIELNSLDVYTKDVRMFNLTGWGDSVQAYGAEFGLILYSEGGDDSLAMTDFSDIVEAGNGNDTVFGVGGNDSIHAGKNDDVVLGGDGHDTIAGQDGNDLLFGELGNDVISGGASRDIIYGGEGADTISGGSGDDTIEGEDGDDFIDGGTGSDFIVGGAGNDTILAGGLSGGSDEEQILGGDGNDIIYVTGDISDKNNIFVWGGEQTPDTYNEADTFVVSGTSETINRVYVGNDSGSEEYDMYSDLLITGVSTLARLTPAGLFGGIAAQVGMTLLAHEMKQTILGGTRASGQAIKYEEEVASSSSIVNVQDFDPWVDTLVIALDAEVSSVTGLVVSSTDDAGSITAFTVNDYKFLELTLDNVTSSILSDGDYISAEVLEGKLSEGIQKNVILNSIVVSRSFDEDNNETISARTLSGINLLFDEMAGAGGDAQTAMENLLEDEGEAGSDGVWILGDFGNSILFGNGMDLAGTNSNNVMYSGIYTPNEARYSSWYTKNQVSMYGGAGNDTIYGGEASNDALYGGSGDDVLHGLGVGMGRDQDLLYGGTGFDIASFESIYSKDGDSEISYYGAGKGNILDTGIYASLSEGNAWMLDVQYVDVEGGKLIVSTDFNNWSKEYLTNGALFVPMPDPPDGMIANIGKKMADFYDIEGIEGSDRRDILVGDGAANLLRGFGAPDLLIGEGGADVLAGDAGDDTLFGGTGTDTFVIGLDDGEDVIVDLEIGDVLRFDGATQASDVSFEMKDKDGYTEVTYGTSVAKLYGVGVGQANFTATTLSDEDGSRVAFAYHVNGYQLTAPEFTFESEETTGGSTGASSRLAQPSVNLTDGLSADAASQSAQYGSYTAANVLDGDLDTFNHTTNSADSWVSVDLGRDATIDTIDIANRNSGANWVDNRINGAVVQVLDDGDVVWTSGALTGDQLQSFDADGTVGDEVRVSLDTGIVHVAEIDVFGDYIQDIVNLTDTLSDVSASQSTTWQAGYEASNVLDGDASTVSHTDHNDVTPWLSVDLGQDTWISSVDIANRYSDPDYRWFHTNDHLENAVVEVLNNGTVVWTSDNLGNDISQSVETGGVFGDEVRINQDRVYLHVSEVDVFGDTFEVGEHSNLTDTLSADAVTQSSNYSATLYQASNILDGDIDTFNHTAASDQSPTLSLDLGDDALISSISLVNRNDAGYEDILNPRLVGAIVQVLDDGNVVWQSEELTAEVVQDLATDDVFGDQVQIVQNTGSYLHIAELDVFGTYVDDLIF